MSGFKLISLSTPCLAARLNSWNGNGDGDERKDERMKEIEFNSDQSIKRQLSITQKNNEGIN